MALQPPLRVKPQTLMAPHRPQVLVTSHGIGIGIIGIGIIGVGIGMLVLVLLVLVFMAPS